MVVELNALGYRVEVRQYFNVTGEYTAEAVIRPDGTSRKYIAGNQKADLAQQWDEAIRHFESLPGLTQEQADHYAVQISEGLGLSFKAVYFGYTYRLRRIEDAT